MKIVKSVFSMPGSTELNTKMKFECILALGMLIIKEDENSTLDNRERELEIVFFKEHQDDLIKYLNDIFNNSQNYFKHAEDLYSLNLWFMANACREWDEVINLFL